MTRPEKTALFIMGVVGWIIRSPVSLVKWFHTKLLKRKWYAAQWQKYLDAVRRKEDQEIEALIRKHNPNFKKTAIEQVIQWYVPHRLGGRWTWCEPIRYRPDWYWCVILSGCMLHHFEYEGRNIFVSRMLKEVPRYEDRKKYWEQMWIYYYNLGQIKDL